MNDHRAMKSKSKLESTASKKMILQSGKRSVQRSAYKNLRAISYIALVILLASAFVSDPSTAELLSQKEPKMKPSAARYRSIIIFASGANLFGAIGQNSLPAPYRRDVWNTFVEVVKQHDPLAVFALGDHARRNYKLEWSWAREGLKKMAAPVHLLRGDRDNWNLL